MALGGAVAKAKPRGRGERPGVKKSKSATRTADSVERVYESIKAFAVEYRFGLGQRINEVELANNLGVSRTPVRQALNRLVSDGFMRFVPNRGFFSHEIQPEKVRNLYELRAAIERAAFRLACERATDAEIESAAAIWQKSGNPKSHPNWVKIAEADEAFHTAIARLSKNPQIVEALEGINSRIRLFRQVDLETPHRRATLYKEHAKIISHLRGRKAAIGADAIEKHIILSSSHAVEVVKESLARIFFVASKG